MLLERLYQGLDIPNNTKTEHVLSLHDHLVGKLKEAMEKRHIWLAACTLAVNAGMWKGRRLRSGIELVAPERSFQRGANREGTRHPLAG